jgi:hypothetical protein
LAETPAWGENAGVVEPGPNVKRYALVANYSNNGVRRFHLARVAYPRAQRLERMEDVAGQEREREEARHESQPGVD